MPSKLGVGSGWVGWAKGKRLVEEKLKGRAACSITKQIDCQARVRLSKGEGGLIADTGTVGGKKRGCWGLRGSRRFR